MRRKTSFVLDPRPWAEATSAHAGLLSVSRAFRSLGLPGMKLPFIVNGSNSSLLSRSG
jgi:hypothetical protein